MYKNAVLQLWAFKPSVAVDSRQWYRVKSAGDTTFVGTGDTMTFVMDTTCRFIARNVNNCTCGGTYYSAYTQMASITVVDSPSVPQYMISYDSHMCSGSQTNISVKRLTSLTGVSFQYYRDDTPNVTGNVSGNFVEGPLGITLTNHTGSNQQVRFMIRMYKSGVYYDSKSFYITVTPDSPSVGDHCKFPTAPKIWPFPPYYYAQHSIGAHVLLVTDTTITADGTDWYKVLYGDTTYVGSGSKVSIVIDTVCQYIARNKNFCNCDSGTYYSSYALMSIMPVGIGNRNLFHVLNYTDTMASGSETDIVLRSDSGYQSYFEFWRDNALVTGATYLANATSIGTNSEVFATKLTNTTSVPQTVRFYIRGSKAGVYYGDTYMGYFTVMPAQDSVATGSHCTVPPKPTANVGTSVTYVKGATIYLNLQGATNIAGAYNIALNSGDSVEYFKSRGPGDTTYVGSGIPQPVTVDTTIKLYAVSKNVCTWSDGSKHILKSAPSYLNTIVSTSGTSAVLNMLNKKPTICNGDSVKIIDSIYASTPSVLWYRSNQQQVLGTYSGSTGTTSVGPTISPVLTDTGTAPQRVDFISFSKYSSSVYNSQHYTSVTIYPACSNWSGFGTAIHALKDSICPGDTTTLTADTVPGIGSHYAWSTGDTTKKINLTIGGTYSVTVTNLCGCYATATHSIFLKSNPVLSVNNDTICPGQSGELVVHGANNYSWSSGQSDSIIFPIDTGIYTVTGTGITGCVQTIQAHVSAATPPIISVRDTSFCAGDTAYVHAYGGVNYVWNTGDSGSSIPVFGSTILSVTGFDNRGCYSSAISTIRVLDRPVITMEDTIVTRQRDSVQLCSSVSFGQRPYTYSWLPNTQLYQTSDRCVMVYPDSSAFYTETVTDSNGCTASKGVYINVDPRGDSISILVLSDTLLGIKDTLPIMVSKTVSVSFMNNGNGNYDDSLIIIGGFDCDSCVTVTQLRLMSSLSTLYEIDKPTFPIVIPRIIIPQGASLRMEEDLISIHDSCLSQLCSQLVSLQWKDKSEFNSTSQVPISVTHRPRSTGPDLTVQMISSGISTCGGGSVTVAFSSNISSDFQISITPPAGATVSLTGSIIPSGFTASVSGNQIIISTLSPTSYIAGTSYSLTFQEQLPCSFVVQGVINLAHLVEVSNYSGSYSIDNGPTNTNQNHYVPLTYSNIVLSGNGTQGVGMHLGTPTIFDLRYQNSGNQAFTGALTIDQSASCNASVAISLVQIFEIGNPTPIWTSPANPVFPLVTSSISIPANSSFYIEETASLISNSCLQQPCQTHATLTWSCSTGACSRATSPWTINFNPANGSPAISASRLLPSPIPFSFYNAGYPWEVSCADQGASSETQWDYIVENNGQGDANNVRIELDKWINESYTFVDESTVGVNVRANVYPNIAFTSSATLGIGTPAVTYLTSADFSGTPPACLNSLQAPLKTWEIQINTMPAGSRILVSFKTYKCCPSNADFGDPIYFNQWHLTMQGEDCSGNSISTHGAGPISLNGIVTQNSNTNIPNLGLTQDYVHQRSEIRGVNNSCGDFERFLIQNHTFNNPGSNNTPDYDAMLFSPHPTTGGTSGLQGGDPTGTMRVIINWQGNMQSHATNFSIFKGAINWSPTSVTVLSSTSIQADFDIATVAAQIGAAQINNPAYNDFSSGFRDFLAESYIGFELKACCPTNVPNPDITVQTLINLAGYNQCHDCFVPLAETTFHLQVHCPGCVTPGLICDKSTFHRTTLGYQDADDDGRPEPATSGMTLQNIDATYQADHALLLERSMVGDILEARVSAFFENGDGTTNGFSYTDWQNYWSGNAWGSHPSGATPYLDDLYLQQDIPGASAVGLASTGIITVNYIPQTGSPISFSASGANPIIVSSSGDHFVYHVNASDFASGLHFLIGDRFEFVMGYSVCGNPSIKTDLDITNEMYLTPSPLSSVSNPYSNYTTAPSENDNLHYPGPAGLSPDASYLYYCEGFSDYHSVYNVHKTSGEAWPAGAFCTGTMNLSYAAAVTSDGTNPALNVFPYEYRPLRSVSTAYQTGLTLTNGNPITATVASITGYIISPSRIYTDCKFYDNIITQPIIRTQTTTPLQIANSGNDYYLNMANAEYIPPFDNVLPFNSNPSSAPILNQSIASNGKQILAIGDERFSQVFEFNVETNCPSVTAASKTIRADDAYLTVPGSVTSCTVSDVSEQNGPHSTGVWTLTIPNPNIQASLSAPIFNQNTISYNLNMTLNANVPNLIYYIDVDPNSVAAGVSLVVSDGHGVINPISVVTPTTTYWRYNLSYALANSTTADIALKFQLNNCGSVPSNQSIDIWYAWSCSGHELAQLPPIATTCDAPAKVTVPLVIPSPNLVLQSSFDPTDYKTCQVETLKIVLTNQSLASVGLTGLQVTLPSGVSLIPGSPVKLIFTRPSQSASTINVASSYITGGYINLKPYAGYIASAISGIDGFNLDDGTIEIDVLFIADCHTNTSNSIPVSFTLDATPYCDPTGATPADVIILNSPTGYAIQPNANPNACGPFFTYTYLCNDQLTINATSGHAPYTYYVGTTPYTTNIIQPNAGTYNIYVKDNSNCTADPISLTTYGVLSVSAAGVSANCSVNAATVTATVAGGLAPYTFSWSNGSSTTSSATANTISGLSSNTYSVTVTDAQGCSVTASASVTSATSLLNVHLISRPYGCTPDKGTIDLDFVGGSAPYAYVWSSSTNITPATQSGLQAYNTYTVTITQFGSYTVTVHDNYGCSVTASANVNTPVKVGSNVSLPTLSSAISASRLVSSALSGTTPQSFIVDGTFTVDQAYTLFNSNAYCLEGAEIIVDDPGRLTISQSTLQGCDYLWKGITVKNKAFNMDNSQISDALYAVEFRRPGHSIATLTPIQNCRFLNNFIGIYIPTSPADFTGYQFFDNLFDGTGGIKTPYTSLPLALGLMPTQTQISSIGQSWAGIYAQNALVFVYSTQHSYATGAGTHFKNMCNGIMAEGCDLRSYGSIFENMPPSSYYTNSGAAIYCDGSVNGAGPLGWTNLQVFGGALGSQYVSNLTNFSNCFAGVVAKNLRTNLEITSNNFDNLWAGISVMSCNNMSGLKVSNSKMTNISLRGINIVDCSSADPEITANAISTLGTSYLIPGYIVPAVGIDLQNMQGQHVVNLPAFTSVDGNVVDLMAHSFAGINIASIISGDYYDNLYSANHVKFHDSENQYGLCIANTRQTSYCNLVNVDNTVFSAPVPLSTGKHIGFLFASVSGKRIIMNHAIGTNIGMLFNNNNLGLVGSYSISDNTFQDHNTGLYIPSPTQIPAQSYLSFNNWSGSYGNGGHAAVNTNSSFIVANQHFDVNSPIGTTIYWPRNSSTTLDIFPSSNWFRHVSNSASQSSVEQPCSPALRVAAPADTDTTTVLTDMDEAVINGEIMDSDLAPYQATMLWQVEKSVYDKLKQHPEMRLSGSAEEYFYDQRTATSIGHISDIEDRLEQELSALPEGLYTLMQQKHAQDSIRDSIVSLLNGKPSEDSITLTLLMPIDSGIYTLDSLIGVGHDSLMAARLANLGPIISDIDTLGDDSLDIVQNAKTVYKRFATIQAHGWGVDSISPTDRSNIEYVAAQCPLQGGYPVYAARAVKALWSHDTYVDDSICANPPSYKTYRAPAAYHSPSPKKQSVKVYPNPTDGVLYIRYTYDPDADCLLTIMDMEGRLVRSEKLIFTQGTLRYDVGDLPFGLYCVRLQRNGETIYSDKINIVK
ncbi:MAG: T9SS type A sorting domain-containing protein [Bacteroidetes bacterium]|nr:T9SS type A sorting domain-containing protein [Bacteroidota bacterium]